MNQRIMPQIEAISFFQKEVRPRWSSWNPTEVESSDWIRRIASMSHQEAKIVFQKMSDISYGQKPFSKDFFEVQRSVRAAMPKENEYKHICVHCVLMSKHLNQRWEPGYIWSLWFNEIPASTDITDPNNAERLFNATREYMLNHGIEPFRFAFYLDHKSAVQKSSALKESA